MLVAEGAQMVIGGQFQRYQTAQWQQMLDVNLTGAFSGSAPLPTP